MSVESTRRAVLAGGVALALTGAAPARAFGADRYRSAMVIDALGSLGNADPAAADVKARLAAFRASGLTAIHQTVGAASNMPGRFEETLRRIARFHRFIEAYPEHLLHIRSAADLAQAEASGRLGVIFGFQDTVPLEGDAGRLDLFKALGLRIVQLTYNKGNLAGDGCLEPRDAGLTDFGRQVVAGLNERRIMVDASHAGRRTIAETIAASTAPMTISHTGCRALVDFPRNTDDASLRALADKGGVAGIYFMPFLRERGQPRAADLIRHIEHAVKVAGEDHVALGTDGPIEAVPMTPESAEAQRRFYEERKALGVAAPGEAPDVFNIVPDYNEPARFLKLADDLSARGWPARRIENLLGGNFARLCAEVWG